MFMVRVLVQSTAGFGYRAQNRTADNEHLFLDAEVRQDSSSMTQRRDLCRLAARAEKPAFRQEFLVLDDPPTQPQIPGIYFFS